MEIEDKNQSNNNFDDIMDLFEIDYVPKQVKRFISNFGNKFGINYSF